MKMFIISSLLFFTILTAQTRFGIMVNSHISHFENIQEAKFESNYKFMPFLAPTFLINFVKDDFTLSLRPGYYYSNPLRGFTLGGYFMKNFYKEFYATAGVNFLFPSNDIDGNSQAFINDSKTFAFVNLGIGYAYKKLLFEINYEVNLSNPVYGSDTYIDQLKAVTKETKIHNIIKIGFGLAI